MSQVRRVWFPIVVGLLFCSSIVVACGPSPTEPVVPSTAVPTLPPTAGTALGRDPNTLIVSAYEGISGIDPPGFPSASGSMIQRSVYETLLTLKPGPEKAFEYRLAESYDVNEDNSVWTFHLRHGVKFHDGTPFNAQVVKDNYTRMVQIELGLSGVLGRFLTDPENQMKVVDDYTIQFSFDQPQPFFADALAVTYGAWIVSPELFSEAHWVNEDWGHEWLDTHAVGTGPYELTEFKPEEQIVLTRNEDYWQGWEGKHFDKIVVKIIEDISANRQLLEKGDIDLAVKVTPEDWEALQKNPLVVAHNDFGIKYTLVFMGCYGPLASPEARQAMSYAFDYAGYVDGLRRGQVKRLYGPFTSSQFGYDPNIFKYETNLDKAKQLLEKAGVAPGTELVWLTAEAYAPDADLLMQAQLEKLGLKLRIEKQDSAAQFTTLFSDSPAEGRFSFGDMGWWPDYDDPWNAAQALWHSENWGSKGANASYYANAKADELLNKMRTAVTKEEIESLAKEFQNVLTEQDPPALWLSEDPDQTVLRSDVKGYEFIPLYTESYPFYSMYRGE